jgi:hypothetical protein
MSNTRSEAVMHLLSGMAPRRNGGHWGRTATAACLVILSACQSSTSSDDALSNSAFVQQSYSSQSLVGTPTKMHAGVPFDLVLHTYAGDKCDVVDRTELTRNGKGEFVITPFNRTVVNADGTCGVSALTVMHTVRLTYATPGEKRVIVRGRDYTSKAVIQLNVTLFVDP